MVNDYIGDLIFSIMILNVFNFYCVLTRCLRVKLPKPKNVGFFCPNINASEIRSSPKLFRAEIFRESTFSFFCIIHSKAYLEDRFISV